MEHSYHYGVTHDEVGNLLEEFEASYHVTVLHMGEHNPDDEEGPGMWLLLGLEAR